MQLSYRGAHYEAHQDPIESLETEPIGIYRGAPLNGKTYRLRPHAHQTVELTYRGVKYTHQV